jgi:hypothetical protein
MNSDELFEVAQIKHFLNYSKYFCSDESWSKINLL